VRCERAASHSEAGSPPWGPDSGDTDVSACQHIWQQRGYPFDRRADDPRAPSDHHARIGCDLFIGYTDASAPVSPTDGRLLCEGPQPPVCRGCLVFGLWWYFVWRRQARPTTSGPRLVTRGRQP